MRFVNQRFNAVLLFSHLTSLILSYFIVLYHVPVCAVNHDFCIGTSIFSQLLWVCVCGYVSVCGERVKCALLLFVSEMELLSIFSLHKKQMW